MERYRHYQPRRQSHEAKSKKPKSRGLRLFFVAIIAAGLYLGFMTLDSSQSNLEQPTENVVVEEQPTIQQIESGTWDHIKQVVDVEVAANPTLNIAVSLVDVQTNAARNFGDQIEFAGASTTKVLTAVAYFTQVEAGTKTLEQPINGFSAQHQLQQMINQSNNESWSALNLAVGHAELEAYAHSIGMASYQFSGNTLQAKDEALLLSKLARGELISEKNRALLYSYMQNTNNEDMIPVVVPEGATLYHKYGQLEDRLHDAAIVEYKDRPLVLVIYTKGVPSAGSAYTTRTAQIQSLAQNIMTIFYQNL